MKKTVLITGGGKGIGFGVATAFAKEGYQVVITGRTLETLEQAKKKLEEYTEVLVLSIDGGKEDEVKNGIDEIIKKFGTIDVVINNAQNSASGVKLIDHTTEQFNQAIYSGLYATFYYMKYAFPYLKETRGSVINFASGAGISGRDGQSSYAAAKEGIRGLSRVAATEWGEFGVRVNVICPLVETPGLSKWKEEYPDLYQKTIGAIPLGRFADAENDIGRVCLFLASKDANYITGETITLQGGSGLRP